MSTIEGVDDLGVPKPSTVILDRKFPHVKRSANVGQIPS